MCVEGWCPALLPVSSSGLAESARRNQSCVAVNKKDDTRREALRRKAQISIAEVICVEEQSIAGKKETTSNRRFSYISYKTISRVISEVRIQRCGCKDSILLLWEWNCFQRCWFNQFRMHDRREYKICQTKSTSECSISSRFCVLLRAKIGLFMGTSARRSAIGWSWKACLRLLKASNSKMVAATHDADELKMFAWDIEDAWAIAKRGTSWPGRSK